MKINQIAEITNKTIEQLTGESALLQEDLSNLIDVGKTLESGESYTITTSWFDHYTKALIDQIGKVVITNREYVPNTFGIFKDAWEYGATLQKITIAVPEAEDNDAWKLVDGNSYCSEKFYQPTVKFELYNIKDTFQVPMSITEEQVKSAFTSATQMGAFVGGIYTAINTALKLRLEALARRCVNGMIAETLDKDTAGIRAINLLSLYNTQFSANLTKSDALTTEAFLRYASYIVSIYKDRVAAPSRLYNINGELRFTGNSDLRILALADFAKSLDSYLYADVYHNEMVKLEGYATVPYWQGSGEDFAITSTSKIDVKLPSDNSKSVEQDGILAVMFDKEACAITNEKSRVTSAYSARGEFTTLYYKEELGLLNDMDQNFIVFYIGEDTVTP